MILGDGSMDAKRDWCKETGSIWAMEVLENAEELIGRKSNQSGIN